MGPPLPVIRPAAFAAQRGNHTVADQHQIYRRMQGRHGGAVALSDRLTGAGPDARSRPLRCLVCRPDLARRAGVLIMGLATDPLPVAAYLTPRCGTIHTLLLAAIFR